MMLNFIILYLQKLLDDKKPKRLTVYEVLRNEIVSRFDITFRLVPLNFVIIKAVSVAPSIASTILSIIVGIEYQSFRYTALISHDSRNP